MEALIEAHRVLGLTLNYAKTEIILMENYPRGLRCDPEWVINELDVGGFPITPQPVMKYLGVMLDHKLQFREHVSYLNGKVKKVINKLSLVFRNTFGYGNAARRLMVKGCLDTLYKYASTIWDTALQYVGVVNSIRTAQRKCNTLCGRSYKDISFGVSTVLAGIPPWDLIIEMRGVLHRYKKKMFPIIWLNLEPIDISRKMPVKELRNLLEEKLLKAWDEVYCASTPADSWCRTLIPRVAPETLVLAQRPNFLLSQAISGHGAFNAYLHHIGKRTSPLCKCGTRDQTPSHVFRDCNLYEEGRPTEWREGVAAEEVRRYLIETTRKLWKEEKEEEKSGENRTRRGSRCAESRTGASITGAGSTFASR